MTHRKKLHYRIQPKERINALLIRQKHPSGEWFSVKCLSAPLNAFCSPYDTDYQALKKAKQIQAPAETKDPHYC